MANIIISASNSSVTWKSQSTVICDGVSDQNEINTYLISGNTVTLAPGDFYISGLIRPKSNSRLLGQGNSTILHMNSTYIYVNYVSDVELGDFNITGTGDSNQSGIFIIAGGSTYSGFNIHDITNTMLGVNDFYVYVSSGGTINDIVFSRCDASNPDGHGFLVNGSGTNPQVQNIIFYKCTAENAGVASSRLTDWITGFDFAEYSGLTVTNLQAIQCSNIGSWESDYHFEIAPTKIDMVIVGSQAYNAGLKTGGATYGAGILASGDLVLSNNSGSNNALGDIRVFNGSQFVSYPFQDMVIGSTKTATRVNQGNCLGVIITDGIYKELVLYTADGNPVNQQIDLGGYYAPNDGNTYTFSGTKILVQFSDYAVINLVATTAPPLVANFNWVANGLSVTFTDSSSGEQPGCTYGWNFGD